MIAKKPYSYSPADSFLSIVIRERLPIDGKTGFVVHTHNAQQDGYSNGFYCETLQEAMQNFNERGICAFPTGRIVCRNTAITL